MISVLNRIDTANPNKLILVIIMLAILVATQIQYIQHGWINPDSVLYLESARLITLGDWQSAVKVFNWPLYSTLITAVHQLTGLGIHHSAQTLSIIFYSITAFSFIKIIQLAGGNNRVMIAGALILLNAQYLTGDVLQMLLRDEGFWAFFLTSIVFFIRFYKNNHYTDALFWQLSAIAATLFRIEAIAYLIALPLSVFFYQQATFFQKLKQFIKCNFLNIFAITAIFAAILVIDGLSMKNFGRLNEVFTINVYNELTKQLFAKSHMMSEQVLGHYLDEFAVQGLLMTFVYVIIVKLIYATGAINFALAALTIRFKNNLINNKVFYILAVVALIAVMNASLIITKTFVLSSRYIIALTFMLMIFAAFYLAHLFQYIEAGNKKDRKKKWLIIGLIIFMLLGTLKNVLPKQRGYNYVQDAVAWLKTYNTDNKPVFYDDTRARYYAQAPFIGTWNDNWVVVTDAIKSNNINQYDFLIIHHSTSHPERETYLAKQLNGFKITQRFTAAKNNKSVVIYQKDTHNN